MKLLLYAPLLALASVVAFAQNERVSRILVDIDTVHQLGEAYNFWSIRNFVNQDRFTHPEGLEATAKGKPFMQDVNAVRLIGGRPDGKNEYFQGVDENGELICDFDPLIAIVSGILEGGYKPRIVLDNVPHAMSSDDKLHKYGNSAPPRDYDVFHAYIREVVLSLVDAFGLREVSEWRFRVGTEPDLFPGHWSADMEAYLKLYDFAVHAVTSVIPEADIGPGNILSPLGAPRPGKPKWGLDIIDHAAQGTNYYTGAIGTRLTYFSCSWYDRVGLDGRVEGLSDAVDLIRNRLDRYPQFRSVPIEIAEFMVLHDVHGNRLWGGDTTEWSASWFAAVADQVYQKSITQVHLWDTTTSGVWHPQAHVIAFLEKMAGGQRLSTDVRARHANPDLVGAITVARNESIYLLVYNHAHARTVEDTLTVQLNISDPRVGQGVSWKAEQSQLDADHGVFTRKFLEDCMEAGLSPVEKGAEFDGAIRRWFGPEGVELFDQNIETYRALSNDIKLDSVKLNTNDEGEIEMEFTLPAHSVRMIRIYPER